MEIFVHLNTVSLTPFDTNWKEGSGATPLTIQDLLNWDAISIPTAAANSVATVAKPRLNFPAHFIAVLFSCLFLTSFLRKTHYKESASWSETTRVLNSKILYSVKVRESLLLVTIAGESPFTNSGLNDQSRT